MAMPPALTGKPTVGHSPAMSPSGNPGLAANSMAQVREAVKILQMAVQNIPIGSEAHKSIIESITKLSKAVPAGEASPGVQQTAVRDMAAQQQQGAPMENLMRALSQGGAPGGQPGGAPSPQPQA